MLKIIYQDNYHYQVVHYRDISFSIIAQLALIHTHMHTRMTIHTNTPYNNMHAYIHIHTCIQTGIIVIM